MDGPHWIEYVTAIGTVSATVAALFIALWGWSREQRHRPKLRLLYDAADKGDFVVGFNASGQEQHWCRLRIQNAVGRKSADDVEVVLMALATAGHDSLRSLEGHLLTWSNIGGTKTTVAPGLERHVDLLSVAQPMISDGGGGFAPGGREGDPAPAVLTLSPVPTDGSPILPAGKHWLLLAITARDTNAQFFVVEITHDGKWWGRERVRDHLSAAIVASFRSFGQQDARAWLSRQAGRSPAIKP